MKWQEIFIRRENAKIVAISALACWPKDQRPESQLREIFPQNSRSRVIPALDYSPVSQLENFYFFREFFRILRVLYNRR